MGLDVGAAFQACLRHAGCGLGGPGAEAPGYCRASLAGRSSGARKRGALDDKHKLGMAPYAKALKREGRRGYAKDTKRGGSRSAKPRSAKNPVCKKPRLAPKDGANLGHHHHHHFVQSDEAYSGIQTGIRYPMIGRSTGSASGTRRSGIGLARKSLRVGFAIQRAQKCELLRRALSAVMPVLAYIWR